MCFLILFYLQVKLCFPHYCTIICTNIFYHFCNKSVGFILPEGEGVRGWWQLLFATIYILAVYIINKQIVYICLGRTLFTSYLYTPTSYRHGSVLWSEHKVIKLSPIYRTHGHDQKLRKMGQLLQNDGGWTCSHKLIQLHRV